MTSKVQQAKELLRQQQTDVATPVATNTSSKVEQAYQMLNQTGGTLPSPTNFPVKDAGAEPVQEGGGFGGFIADVGREIVRPIGRLGANLAAVKNDAESIVTGPQGPDAQRAEEIRQKGIELPFVGNVMPVGQTGNFKRDVIDALGAGTEIASSVVPTGKVPAILGRFAQGGIRQGIATGATGGFVTGAMFGAGREAQDTTSTIESTAVEGLKNAAFGGAFGAPLGVAGGLLGRINQRQKFANNPKPELKNELVSIVENNKALSRQVQKFNKDLNTDVLDIISEPEIMSGIKSQGGSIITDEAIATIDNTIDILHDTSSRMIRQADAKSSPVSRQAVRDAAVKTLSGSRRQNARVRNVIDAELAEYPESLSVSQLDDLRRVMFNQGRDTQGVPKELNAFSALEKGSREVLFDAVQKTSRRFADEVGVPAEAFAALRTQMKDYINAKKFLGPKGIGNSKVPGGRLNVLLGRAVGAVAGAKGGPIGSILGSEVGSVVSRILLDNKLGSATRMSIIRNMTTDQKILQQVEQILGEMEKFTPGKLLELPAPAIKLPGRTSESSVRSIEAGKGIPGRRPAGTPRGGQIFKTFSSTGDNLNFKQDIPEDSRGSQIGLSTQDRGAFGRGSEEVFNGYKDLTTKVLNDLQGRSLVSKEFISNLTNKPALKQPERDLIRSVLEEFDGQVNVQEFADKVKARLLPLEAVDTGGTGAKGISFVEDDGITRSDLLKYENITLPSEIRGNVADYDEVVYNSPIKNGAGDIHNFDTDNYFAHTRIEDMADGQTRRVIEAQSDLFQKGRLESQISAAKTRFETPQTRQTVAELAELQPYRNTWWERIIREEVRTAAQDGKTKLQFPTGETAMKIEGLGQGGGFNILKTDSEGLYSIKATPENMKVGDTVIPQGINMNTQDQHWIITEVLGDGKFKAVPKTRMESLARETGESVDEYIKRGGINTFEETFDISGKVDTNNPIYKFYEKDVQKYLNKNYNARRITDENGVEWVEFDVKPEQADLPIEAFGVLPILSTREDESEKNNIFQRFNI